MFQRRQAFSVVVSISLVIRFKCAYAPFLFKAMNELNGKEMGGSHIEVSLAKPPSDKKKKEEMLRARERRMMQMLQGRGG